MNQHAAMNEVNGAETARFHTTLATDIFESCYESTWKRHDCFLFLACDGVNNQFDLFALPFALKV